jgi:type VI protein secretion system component Hcp
VFLSVSGVDGQSEDPNHDGWIDAEAYRIGVLRLPQSHEFSGDLAGSDLVVVTPFDVTSQAVFDKLVQDETIDLVQLDWAEPFGNRGYFAMEHWDLQNAQVTRVVRDSDEPVELAFSYAEAEFCQFERNEAGNVVSRACTKFSGNASTQSALQAGDADQDLDFDQLDLVRVQQAGTYLMDKPATWGSGDWNAAPGGFVGSPPIGDGRFNQLDIVAAQQAGVYLKGPYAATGHGELAKANLNSVAVPEPSTIVLTLLALWLLPVRSRVRPRAGSTLD